MPKLCLPGFDLDEHVLGIAPVRHRVRIGIVEEIQKISFDDPKGIELGLEYCKLAAQEMPITPLMAYNVFTTMDTTFFTGYPSIDDPYTDPVPNWANTKYMFVKIKPKTM